MLANTTRAVLAASRHSASSSRRPLLLAVSGGLDSMALLAAMSRVARGRIAAVATFDHGTGEAATVAVGHVRLAAERLGVPVVSDVMRRVPRAADGREAEWRKARYEFLHATAERLGAMVVTAHTADDQVETVLLRIMRGTGARGLAALYAESAVLRPYLAIRRADLKSYALETGVTWVDDPSNESRAFARNRVRHDLLPAIQRLNPAFGDELLALAGRADRLRREVESFVDEVLRPQVCSHECLVVASGELMDYDAHSQAMLWPALAGRVGLALDARGIRRIASFASSHPCDGSIPLAGGWCLEATCDTYTLRKCAMPADTRDAATLPRSGSLTWGDFQFRVGEDRASESVWVGRIAAADAAVVRHWRPGDRLAAAAGQQPRRVKRYLSDVEVRGADRAQWPVVAVGNVIVWIPGVRRSDAATDRSGRPARTYICERIDR